MRFVVLALLFGCSKLWGVEGYRGDDDSDAAISDSGPDAERDGRVEDSDVPEDANIRVDADDADAGVDAGMDAEPDAFVSCIVTERMGGASVVLMDDTVENTRFTMDTSGTAITVRGPVMFRNVEIVVRNRDATGLLLAAGATGSTLENVRVVFDTDDATMATGHAIRIDGANSITATNVEIAGMNVAINNAAGINITTLDMMPPGGSSGLGSSAPLLELSSVTTVMVTGFHFHDGDVFRAIDCSECGNVDFVDGYINVNAFNWPFYSETRMFTSVNQLTNTAIVGSRRGVFLSGGEWDVNNVQVERTAECLEMDYAFDVAGSPDSSLIGRASRVFCREEPLRGAGSVSPRPVELEPMPTIDFCFERTGVVF